MIKGIVGYWKNHFNKEHKKYVKNFAGNFLVNIDYKKHL